MSLYVQITTVSTLKLHHLCSRCVVLSLVLKRTAPAHYASRFGQYVHCRCTKRHVQMSVSVPFNNRSVHACIHLDILPQQRASQPGELSKLEIVPHLSHCRSARLHICMCIDAIDKMHRMRCNACCMRTAQCAVKSCVDKLAWGNTAHIVLLCITAEAPRFLKTRPVNTYTRMTRIERCKTIRKNTPAQESEALLLHDVNSHCQGVGF